MLNFHLSYRNTIPPRFQTLIFKVTRSTKFYKVAKRFQFLKTFKNKKTYSTMPSNSNTFCLNNYDVIGFDLDQTLCKYKIQPLSELVYKLMVNYLVNTKNYSPEIAGTYPEACNFFQKGIVADLLRGNFLKLSADCTILLAYHGTKHMEDEEIKSTYGIERKYKVAENLLANLCMPQPTNLNCHMFRDYFVVPSLFIAAKIIDILDSNNSGKGVEYEFWPDFWSAIQEMFKVEHFQLEIGGYFSAIRRDPHRYVEQNSPVVLEWLKELKKTKKIFLLTNSYFDIAEVLLKNCIGPDWRDYFDFVGSQARKPGFFTGHRPYFIVENYTALEITPGEKLLPKTDYSQGNWTELNALFKKMCNKKEIKCCYFGDSVLDDVYAPTAFANCDTVAIVEELASEREPPTHTALLEINSTIWGSFFRHDLDNQIRDTFMNSIIAKYSQIAIPDIETLAKIPITKELPNLRQNKNGYICG